MAAVLAPPGPRSIIPLGALLRFRHDPLVFLTHLARQYGDVAQVSFGSQQLVLLNHPDHIHDVLVTHHRNFHKGRGLERARVLLGNGLLTSEGEFHRRQRRLAAPAFHRQRVESYGSVMVDYTTKMLQRWQSGATIDLDQEMMRLTLAIAGSTLFGSDVEDEASTVGEALTDIMEMFRIFQLPFGEFFERLPLPRVRRFERQRARLDATIYRMIAERRASGKDRGDLLSMLLQARDEFGDGGGMTDMQLRDEILTILLAGHETTANALTWTIYLLSQHPQIEAVLLAELDEVLSGRGPTVADLPQLRYTRRVLSEGLRLYPPAWVIGRRALSDYQVGGYQVPARTIVAMSQWVMHRDPRYYPDPDRFDPDRWTPEQQEQRPRYAYFPFGGGPRICIGESFAWMEGTLCLATIMQHWRLRLVPGHPVGTKPLITLRPRYGMRMKVEQRINARGSINMRSNHT